MTAPQQSALITYGSPIIQVTPAQRYAYDGTTITSFISKNGGDWREWRQCLKDNKVGSVFSLPDGQPMAITKAIEPFTVNLNA